MINITLSGTASNATNLSRAMSIAEAYAPKKVINSMQVGGVQQVMLEVRVAEMNRELDSPLRHQRHCHDASRIRHDGIESADINAGWKQLCWSERWCTML